MPRVVAFVALITLCMVPWPLAARAQTSSAASTARQTPATRGFLTHYNFHLNAAWLVSRDDRFVWDTDFGGDLDFVDFRRFRGNLLVNFEGILGEQLRTIDPNQGNFAIDVSAWWRTGVFDTELGATVHHVSRHLFDRDKESAIDWNMVGFQHTVPLQFRSWDIEIGSRALKTIQRSFVDYTGEVGGSIQALRVVHPGASLSLGAELTFVAVEQSERGRDHQLGGRVEIGVRFPGGDGAGELFIARERRIDAEPFDLVPTTFTLVGFRLLH